MPDLEYSFQNTVAVFLSFLESSSTELKSNMMISTYVRRPDEFEAVALDIEDTSNILFSSGTTGANKEKV